MRSILQMYVCTHTYNCIYFFKSCSFCIQASEMHVCILIAFYYARECYSRRAFKNNLSDRATQSTEENHLLFLPRPSLFLSFSPSLSYSLSLSLSLCVLVFLFLSTSFSFFIWLYRGTHEGREGVVRVRT